MRVAETFRNVAVTTGDGYASNAWNAQQAERPDEAVLTTQTTFSNACLDDEPALSPAHRHLLNIQAVPVWPGCM